MKVFFPICLCVALLAGCNNHNKKKEDYVDQPAVQRLGLKQANALAKLPLKCLVQEYPNKLSQTLSSPSEIGTPKSLHPAFYGCFDWHSSVHGHWMLVRLLKGYPNLDNKEAIISTLQKNLSEKNIKLELAYFMRKNEHSFERTYGWAWLLKLAEEIHDWNHPIANELSHNLQPLTDYVVFKFIEFLPKLRYPIRVGEHTNTAFGLSLAYDYALSLKSNDLKKLIEDRARAFFLNDVRGPLSWEPSGYDFLSPCLEEANLMRKILPRPAFKIWYDKFLPQTTDRDFELPPAIVSDRSDGKLVHLDGLNFSRAWCLNGIANAIPEYQHLRIIANKHINQSLPYLTNGEYMGEHWLASFALYALSSQ